MLSLANIKKIYFIGIGGIGMSAVAGIASHKGYEVSGSDAKTIYPPAKTVLDKYSIKYAVPYKELNIKKFLPDLAVIGGGEGADNPEVQFALDSGIRMTSFAELLHELVKDKRRIVVAGTHGKTTTTALASLMLKSMGENPGFFIGGLVQDFQTNFHYSPSPWFVMEGDEYYSSFFDRHPKFFYYRPEFLLINNIEMDHFDFFSSKEQLFDAFRRLALSVPANGVIVANADDENVHTVLAEYQHKIVWYSTKNENCEWFAKFLRFEDGFMVFEIYHEQQLHDTYFFPKPGEHVMKDVLAAVAVCELAGDSRKATPELRHFRGAKRRFEMIAEVSGIKIIDDYAHHPTAVRYTVDAAKKFFPESRIVAVYEPHTFTRTKETLPQLASAFFSADEVILSDIYPAREKHLSGLISGKKVFDEVKKEHKNVKFLPGKDEVLTYLASHLKKGDVLLVMAVGAFNQIGEELAKILRKKKRAGAKSSGRKIKDE